ncbi:MAG: RNase H-like domain-containing protein, partial [Candidatus Thiodiazotropha endolucinida]|nr:RNase H-like domain-containing protein [Candidatus Thiodiazotropha endolucinida]
MASGDAYNQRFDAIITDFKNKVKCVDDTCMWENSIEAAFFQACKWFDLCARNGITLNPKKFQFAQDTVDFAGLTITPTNIRPSTKFLDAIRNFPTPTDITGARAWFGLINQGAYAFAMTRQMKPFRALLKPSTVFQWTDELEELFHKSKEVIIKEMKEGVRLFDPTRLTCLATDWSVDGIGFFLMQKYCQCLSKTPACCQDGWKLCLVGSRFTHPAESRYAPIEGEALAVVYALHQTRYYVLGCKDLIVATDHKPLLQILNDRSLTDISNRRLLNLKEKTLGYKFTVVHVPGRKNLGPDAASRHPAGDPEHLLLPGEESESETQVHTPVSCHDALPSLYQHADNTDTADDSSTVAAATCALNAVVSVVTWDMVREATSSDPVFASLMQFLETGFPDDCRELPADLRPYHRFAASLCVVDGVVLMGQRIVIPPTLRQPILNALHAAHQGVSAMRARAMDSVYWPDITIDIARVRDQCAYCHRIAKSNPMQPPSDLTLPDYPFQMICSDYFTFNSKEYVVIVDRYSNWPMVYRSESGAEGLIKRLRETFVTFGIPEELTSDGGPQFTAGKTQEFLKAWGVRHRISSVANPHANCRAELAVKTVKRMLMDNITATGSLDIDKFQRALLMYRNSVDPETKASPALILFGRPIRDAIPIPLGRYTPHETWTELLSHRELALARRHSRDHERWKERTHKLPPLQVGDHVYLQNLVGNHPRRWERTGIVVEVRQYHQYVIRMDGTGRVTIRNRQHLRKFTPFHIPSIPGLSVTPTVEKSGAAVTSRSTPVKTSLPQVFMPTTPPPPPGDCNMPISPGMAPTGTSTMRLPAEAPTKASMPRNPHIPLSQDTASSRAPLTGIQGKTPARASTPTISHQPVFQPRRLTFS